MGPTLGDAPTGGPAAAAPSRRAPMALVTWAFVVLVLVIVLVLLVVKITRPATPVPSTPAALAPSDVVAAAATVPDKAFDTVGAPALPGPGPALLAGQPALLVKGLPAVVYVGAEFCPYCAAERWALVVALSRFGTFSRLGQTMSSASEVFPQIQTFSFAGATYRSRYLSWVATEEYGQALATTAPAGFPPLTPAPSVAQELMTRYGSAVAAPGVGATLPFVDIGNRVLIEGAGIGFSPGALQDLGMAQIATDLSDPTSPVAQAVLGAANEITAAICATTGARPGRLCRSPGVRAGAGRLGL